MSFVLIVDDHVDTCHLMQRLVRRLGPAARCVYSGRDALAMACDDVPALVLLDISMPEMSGLETLKRLRATPVCGRVPVVMLTAINDAETRSQALELGANDYLLKAAFDMNKFRRVLGTYVPLGAA